MTRDEAFAAFLDLEAAFLKETEAVGDAWREGANDGLDEEALASKNRALYAELLPENYAQCYGNPAYATELFGDAGAVIAAFYAEFRAAIPLAYEGRKEELALLSDLLAKLFEAAGDSVILPDTEQLIAIYRAYALDNEALFADARIASRLDPSRRFFVDQLMGTDLSDARYLYRFGEYVTEDEVALARFLAGMTEEEIDRIARIYTEGFRKGFAASGKDIKKKRTVDIRYHLGFERIVRAAVRQFAEMGLSPIISRVEPHAVQPASPRLVGVYGAFANRQYSFDHRNDCALYLDEAYVQKRLEALEAAYEKHRLLASDFAGPAWIETFGEASFDPIVKEEAPELDDAQHALLASMRSESSRIANRYIKGEESSYTIIAFPMPEIGENFPQIFLETVRINSLDYQQYQRIQQTIIDALDQGTSVHVVGAGGNRTELLIRLHALADPDKQTIFENCVADVNIPVGEVFTSPVLAGTNGVLHVSRVYLEGYEFRELSITLADGMVTDYDCKNFARAEENRRAIEERILYHHESVPIGEFAIGTNTTAYAVAHKYGIAEKFPILIAEKMGPHFAFGDTCYSFEEDYAVYNPDGKEIIARENERSALREKAPEEAYFGCHTDVTLPYEEIGLLEVLCDDGRRIPILSDGRFVLPGTEELNEALQTV